MIQIANARCSMDFLGIVQIQIDLPEKEEKF